MNPLNPYEPPQSATDAKHGDKARDRCPACNHQLALREFIAAKEKLCSNCQEPLVFEVPAPWNWIANGAFFVAVPIASAIAWYFYQVRYIAIVVFIPQFVAMFVTLKILHSRGRLALKRLRAS